MAAYVTNSCTHLRRSPAHDATEAQARSLRVLLARVYGRHEQVDDGLVRSWALIVAYWPPVRQRDTESSVPQPPPV